MDTTDDARLRSALAGAGYGGTLRGVDLRGARLASAVAPDLLRLDRCLLAGADLRHATLDGCRFLLCDLTGADLRGASLRGASFAGCDLTGADLRDADLFDASFGSVGVGRGARRTVLDGARFDGAALRSVRFEEGVTPPA